MDDFIKKIFEIDKDSDDLKKVFEQEKRTLLEKRDKELKEIDEKYNSFIKEQEDILTLEIKNVERENVEKLDSFVQKSEEIKKTFKEKKDFLIDDITNCLLESGEVIER